MGARHENEREFKAQSYWRLLKYAKPYRWRLAVGILAGFLVGGSLLVSLLVIPQMVGVLAPVESKTAKAAWSAQSEAVVNALAADPALNHEQQIGRASCRERV